MVRKVAQSRGIIKNEIPLLGFDSEQKAVLNPTHEKLNLKLPKKCVFAFLGAYIDEYASKTDARKVSEFISATKNYPIYITKYKGEEVVLCQAPVGVAPAVQLLDWLIGYGVLRSGGLCCLPRSNLGNDSLHCGQPCKCRNI